MPALISGAQQAHQMFLAYVCVRVGAGIFFLLLLILKNYTGRLIRLFMIIQHASD